MNRQQVELYDRIQAFTFDAPGTTYTFAQRLAKENGWSRAYADRVIGEYRHFAFLAAGAGHPVSPSEAVDQAWHLHLVYTRSYWGEFCSNVLRTPLHHEPSRGGAGELAKFDDWYARTLDSYRRFFGEAPPTEIWPAPNVKARSAVRYEPVDRARHRVIPKWRLLAHAVVGVATIAAASIALATGGCATSNGAGDPIIPIVILIGAVMFFLVATVLHRILRGPKDSSRGSGGCGISTGRCGGWSVCGSACAGSGCGGGGCGGGGCGGGGCGGS